MKALTVQQPWAWAIVHGGKDVENRTQAWGYRGPLAIHAGARWSERGAESRLVSGAYGDAMRRDKPLDRMAFAFGALIGVVDLVDVHVAEPEHIGAHGLRVDFCCDSPWAESSYTEHRGRTRRDVVHLVLANPRPLAEPIPCKGRLGLWTPDADVLTQLTEQVPA